MLQTLAGKIALVTGSDRGIGKAIALELAAKGATIIGVSFNQEFADIITAYLKENNIPGKGFVMDVSKLDSIEKSIKEIAAEFGMPNILVNNAGITRDNLVMRMSEREWEDVINTNLTSVFRLSKISIRDMMKARFGRIINIASVVGVTGNAGQANYAAAKAGIIAFSKSLAQEIASRGITVNTVAPGYVATAMTGQLSETIREKILQGVPAGKPAQPEDIAKAVAFLASPDAAYITGQTLHVNGGMSMI
jgi:3-oxoacyl-[acyl-carrier protein] reductase